MAIKDEISRLQQAKEDFKTKLIEKGVTVSDDELISDYPPKLDLIKGGATVTKIGGWNGTAVPNTGVVENVYINTALSVDEVIGIIEQLTYSEDGRCIVLVDSSNTKAIAIFGMDGIYGIQVDGAFLFSNTEELGFIGWNTDLVNPYTFGLEATSVLGPYEAGTQNDLISSLFSTTPFTQSEGETITIEGDYDGSTLVVDELPKGGWQGTTVPNEGFIEKVYFNTNLSVEEVINEIQKIPSEKLSTAYCVFCAINTTTPEMIGIIQQDGVYGIISLSYDTPYFISQDVEMGFVGWNPEFNGVFTINSELISTNEGDEGTIYGDENNLLSSLISTTPFIQSKANTIDVKALIEQKKIPLEIKVNVEEGTNTTDATATANEIRKGFTAYIASGKVEGAIEDYDGSFENEVSGELVERSLKKVLDINKTCRELLKNANSIINSSEILEFSDTSNVTNMYGMFQGCSNLKEVSLFDTSNVTNMQQMFTDCYGLTTVTLNMKSVTNVGVMFQYCKALTNLTLYNIKISLVIGSGDGTHTTHYGYSLTIESLLHTCQECINVNALRTLTVGTANIEKLASVYVKLTGEAEADANNPKLPMVQCESTDEGAMLVSDYMALKQWSLA